MICILCPKLRPPVPLYEFEQEVCSNSEEVNFLAVLDHSALSKLSPTIIHEAFPSNRQEVVKTT